MAVSATQAFWIKSQMIFLCVGYTKVALKPAQPTVLDKVTFTLIS